MLLMGCTGQFHSVEMIAGMSPCSYSFKKRTLKPTSENTNFLPWLAVTEGCVDSPRNVCRGACITSVTVFKPH